jgi:hypothetical protein
MAIEAEFLRVGTAFATVAEVLQSLGLTVNEDRPPRDAVLLVERLGDLVEELRGWAADGLDAAAHAREGVAHPPDFHRARLALGEAHERFIRLEYRFFDEAVAPGTIDGLARFGRQRGGEWLSWSRGVLSGLDACRAPLRSLDEALLSAWMELGDRLGSRSVSLQTTNIGQLYGKVRIGRQPADRTAHGTATDPVA